MPVRSGLPSGVLGIAVFLIWASTATLAATPASRTARRFRLIIVTLRLFASQRTFPVLAVHQLFDELDALEVHQLRVALETTIKWHADLPRLRERLRIRHRRFVGEHVGRRARPALDHLQLVAVEV